MNSYITRRSPSAGVIFFIVFFILVFIGTGYLFYIDQGLFWDYCLYICVPSVIINLILMIFYFVKRSASGFLFLLFFLIFLSIITLSSFFGPFALINSARENYDNKQYDMAIADFKEIIDKYPSSRHANEALESIAYTYYLNGDYEDAINYFNLAIKSDVIDKESLEVKKILSESNLKIAQKSLENQDYKKATDYYLDSVYYFKEIADKFPETNEAFIAGYKIPEYLYMAATSASQAKDWDRSNEIIKDITSEYSQSEYMEKSEELLFNNIIRKSKDLKNSRNYRESIEEFIKVYDLKDRIKNKKHIEIDYNKRFIFDNIPVITLIEVADEKYHSSDSKKAMIIYDYIIKNHEYYEKVILKNLIESKIKTILSDTYQTPGISEPIGSFTAEGNSSIRIENKTDYGLTLYMAGPEYQIVDLEKDTKQEIEIASGLYRIVVEFEEAAINPIYSENNYEEGKIYRQIYELEEDENQT